MAAAMSKEQIAMTALKGQWQNVSIKPKKLLKVSADFAIVTYECSANKKDLQGYRAYVTSGYVRRSGEWKLAFHQQTPVQ
jgi:hypothetical protein